MDPKNIQEHNSEKLIVKIAEPNTNVVREVETRTSLKFEDLMYKFQKIGCTVFINGGTLGGPTGMFAWRVTPRIPTYVRPVYDQAQATLEKTLQWDQGTGLWLRSDGAAYWHPFTPLQEPVMDVDNYALNAVFRTVGGMCAWQYNQEPLLSRWARTHRFWQGSLVYRVRCTASFATQGYIQIALVNGRRNIKMHNRRAPTGIFPATGQLLNDAHDYACTGWMSLDLSSERHLEITVPYQRLYPFYDELMAEGNEWTASGGTCGNNFLDTEQYLVFYLDGFVNTTDGAQLQFNWEYLPGPDFRLVMPIYPKIRTRPKIYGTDEYNLVQNLHFHDATFTSYVIGDHDAAPNAWLISRYGPGETAERGADEDTYGFLKDCRVTRILRQDFVMGDIEVPVLPVRAPSTDIVRLSGRVRNLRTQ